MEQLRLIACVGIVWFHLWLPGDRVALGGLHAFAALTAALAVRSAGHRPAGGVVVQRLRVVGLPWLFWMVVFAVLYARDHRAAPLAWVFEDGILVGPMPHLWYLPFAFALAVLAHPVARLGERAPWPLFALLPLTLSLAAFSDDAQALRAPWAQWVATLPAVGYGFAHALTAERHRRALAVVVVVGVLLVGLATEAIDVALPVVVGTAGAALAFAGARRASPALLRWSGLTLGVYLVHPLLQRALHKPLADMPFAYFAAVLVGTFALVALLKRTRLAPVL